MSPFAKIFRLLLGDSVAKILYFASFIYLARVLGVSHYGTLEFAIAVHIYFTLIVGGGLELWGTREVAQAQDIANLVGSVLPLRLILALLAYGVLLVLLPLFPEYPYLAPVLSIMGLTLIVQAVNLKWVYLGAGKMTQVGIGLALTQLIFTLGVLSLVRGSEQFIWVPVMFLAGELGITLFFWWRFRTDYGSINFNFRGMTKPLRPSLVLSASEWIGQMNYSLDAVLIGFLLNSSAVGLYKAAYRPVTVALALPMTYFIGLFPALSAGYKQEPDQFRAIIERSLRISMIFALPVGVGGTFLAKPLINLLFGEAYVEAVPALQLLCWSTALVILRETYRQALYAAGKQELNLRGAAITVAANATINLYMIPHFGIIGAAATVVITESMWTLISIFYLNRYAARVRLAPALIAPGIASGIMLCWFLLSPTMHWLVRSGVAGVIYFAVLLLLGEPEVRGWLSLGRFLGTQKEASVS